MEKRTGEDFGLALFWSVLLGGGGALIGSTYAANPIKGALIVGSLFFAGAFLIAYFTDGW